MSIWKVALVHPAVMIAAGFIALLGEATLELAPVSSYPLGPFLAALGFLATMLADYAAWAAVTSVQGLSHSLLREHVTACMAACQRA
jgi:hypothetical protein